MTGIHAIINSSLVSYERLPMLDVIFDRLVRVMSTSLRNFTSDNIEVSIDNPGQQLKAKQTTVTGLQQICQDAVASYNAEARKTIRAEWRAEDLPYQIDATSTTSETDCQPAA